MNRQLVRVFILTMAVCFSAQAQDSGVESLRQSGKAFSSVAKSVSPSVVFIQVEGSSRIQQPESIPFPFEHDFFKRFFGESFPGLPPHQELPQDQYRSVSQGSGFVFRVKDGLLADKTYIMTNNHVVEGADKVSVKFNDGKEYEASVTGRDPQSDIAVIEISTVKPTVLPLGDSSKLDVGEWVVAIGNPFGLSHTLTVGVVSATGRTSVGINDYEDFIQTDAAINPGNSGGPLVNLNGEVIGMNTAIFTRTGGYMGIGFAIPINMAKEIANQLIDKGEVSRGYLGVSIQPLTTELAKAFKIKQNQGILVAEVVEDSAADKAGFKQGDVIIAFRGKPVTDVGDFRNKVSLTPPGKQEKITILRDGKQHDLVVTIGARSHDEVVAKGSAQSSAQLGLTVQTLTVDLARQFNARAGDGVVVTEVKRGSVAAMAGIKTGAIILQINRKPIKTADEFSREINKADKEKGVLLLIRSGDMQRYVLLSW
ncbi:MAG: DegQ family serine endoprotease [Gammaproteobacteria bacterium]|nr:DegQ family serine endoprotease [Gammaproteobacteria bacterium]